MICSCVAFFSRALSLSSSALRRKNRALFFLRLMTSRRMLMGALGMSSGLACSTMLDAIVSNSRQCTTTSLSMAALDNAFCALFCELEDRAAPPVVLVAGVNLSAVCFSHFVN